MMLFVLIATQAVSATDTIAGTVTGPGGRPLAGAIVQATSSVTRLSRWQTSDAGGRYTIQFPGRAPYERTTRYGVARTFGASPGEDETDPLDRIADADAELGTYAALTRDARFRAPLALRTVR